jgi:hypothetical protein
MTRQEYMLAVLAAENGEEYSPTQVQKLFFLLDRKVPKLIGGPWFAFEPDAYGPFDRAVFEELQALAGQRLVSSNTGTLGPSSYRLTPTGVRAGQALLSTLAAPTADYIRQLAAWVRRVSFEVLLGTIFDEYPEMKVRAVFQGSS